MEDMLEDIVELCFEEEVLKADGFNKAIIGIEQKDMRLIYSVSKCLDILREDMSDEEALEHFTYNVSGSYVGETTPIWCWDCF